MSLPALTALRPAYVLPECWAGMGGFTELRSLAVDWADDFTAEAALSDSLNSLPQLTDLSVDWP